MMENGLFAALEAERKIEPKSNRRRARREARALFVRDLKRIRRRAQQLAA